MARHKNKNWNLKDPFPGTDGATLAVLMDIRDELQNINRLIGCTNFISVPSVLRQIRGYTSRIRARPRKKKT